MSSNDPTDPTDKKDSAKPPLSDPASPPDPDTRTAAARSGAKGSAMTPGSPTGAAGHTGTSRTSDLSGGPGASGVTGTTAQPASTARPASKVTSSDTGAPGGATDNPALEADNSGSERPGVDRSTSNRGSSFSGQAQKARSEVEATGERAMRETREVARKMTENGRDLASSSGKGGATGSLYSRLEGFVRARPGIVLAGAAIAGLLVARTISASRKKPGKARYQSRSFDRDRYAPSPTATPPSGRGTGFYRGDRLAD